jgi:hypothetical protein
MPLRPFGTGPCGLALRTNGDVDAAAPAATRRDGHSVGIKKVEGERESRSSARAIPCTSALVGAWVARLSGEAAD